MQNKKQKKVFILASEEQNGNSYLHFDRAKVKEVFIIAEIGKNFIQTEKHQPLSVYLKNAKRLVDEAKKSGADAVKFQTHNVEDEQLNIRVISPHFNGSDRYNWVARNTFSLEKFWKPLKAYCDKKNILFFSTPMSRGAAQMLDKLGVSLWKIGSGDILDFAMLDFIRQTKKPVIISSGMSTLRELKTAINFIKQKNSKITVLHCVSKYPCPPEDLNLNSIGYLFKMLNVPVGFSDHSLSIDTAVAAVALGATVIEKHFSLSRDFWGPDHKVSLLPEEFKNMVAGIRSFKKYLGQDGKFLQDDEAVFRPVFRKALVFGQDLKAGTVIKAEALFAMRPLGHIISAIPSENYERVIGKKLRYDVKKYQPVAKNLIK